MVLDGYLAEFKGWFISSGPRVLIILFVALSMIWLTGFVVRRTKAALKFKNPLPEFQKRVETFGSVISYTINIVVVIFSLLMIIREFGLDLGPVFAAAGIVGIAVGFGAQSIVQDIISGFFILLEDQVRVGDVVEIDGRSGVVESVNLRLVVLRDLSGNVHFIRTGRVGTVTNMTKEYSRYVFDISVAYREDVDEVLAVLKELDEDIRHDPEFGPMILEPLEILGLDRFADSALIIRARFKTKPIEQWNVGREFNRRLKKKFDSLGIEMPFPHMTVYMGQDKHGASAALNVKLNRVSD